MSDQDARSGQKPRTRSKVPLFLALAGLVVIIVVVVVVLILAGGDKTKDGTGRDQQSTASPIATTNDKGSGVGDPVK